MTDSIFQEFKNFKVLLVGNPRAKFEAIQAIRSSLDSQGNSISFEQPDRLPVVELAKSTYDVAVSGFIKPTFIVHPDEVFAKLIQSLKANGKLYLVEPICSESIQGLPFRTSEELVKLVKVIFFLLYSLFFIL